MRILLCAELLVLEIFVMVSAPFVAGLALQAFGAVGYDVTPMMALVLVYIGSALQGGAYSSMALYSPLEGLKRALAAFAFSAVAMVSVAFFLKNSAEMSRLGFGMSITTTLLFLIIARALFARHVRSVTGGHLINELLIIDGGGLPANTGWARIVEADAIGLIPDMNNPAALHRFGTLVESFDRILISSVPERRPSWGLMLKGADVDGEILMEEANAVGAIGVRSFAGQETMVVSRKPLDLPARARKRALDLGITIPLLIVGLVPMAIAALAIKLDSAGPIFFRQARVGRGNRQFKVLKFRSMHVERSDADGNRSASRDDDRVTRIGRFIRQTSIDELPQLFNVLIGDMSLVGPRPHALGSLAGDRLFWEVDEKYWLRHQLKPGITGLAQIRGYRGATDDHAALIDRLQADMEYVQGWTLWRDVSILLNTFRVIVHHNAF